MKYIKRVLSGLLAAVMLLTMGGMGYPGAESDEPDASAVIEESPDFYSYEYAADTVDEIAEIAGIAASDGIAYDEYTDWYEEDPAWDGEAPEPDYILEDATVYLADILNTLNISWSNNSTLSVDIDCIELSDYTLKNNNYSKITLTATAYFDYATLTIAKNNDVTYITIGYPEPEEEPVETPEPTPEPTEAPEETPEPTEAPEETPEPAVDADYTFASATVTLEDIIAALGAELTQNNYAVSVDSDAVTLSASSAHKNKLSAVTLTAVEGFALATLTIQSNNGKQTLEITLACSEDTACAYETVASVPADAIWTNGTIYLTGKVPGNAVIEAVPVTADGYGIEGTILAAYDINIYANANQQAKGHKWQPAGDKVTVHLCSEALADAELVDVYHIAHDDDTDTDTVQEVATELAPDENGVVAFEADSFSVYVLVEHEGGDLETPRRFYHFLAYSTDVTTEGTFTSGPYVFKDTANDDVNVEIVKTGDKLVEPPVPPEIKDEQGNTVSTFEGWYVVGYLERSSSEDTKYDGASFTYSYTWDGAVRVDFSSAITVTESADYDYYLAPLYQNSRFVVFHQTYNPAATDVDDAVLAKKLIAISSAGVSVLVSNVSAPRTISTHEYFYGWWYYPQNDSSNTRVEIPLYNENGQSKGDVSITVTPDMLGSDGTLNMYTMYITAYWLNFISGATGSGASYVSSMFVTSHYNGSFNKLATPTRNGYTFAGWYADEDLTKQVTDADGNILANVSGTNFSTDASGRITISDDVTLYAKWTANSVDYTVLYWVQNADDDDYVLGGYETKSGLAGSTTEATEATSSLISDITYFHLSDDQDTDTEGNQNGIQQKTINGDGSTVVNIYYDRNYYTLWFFLGAKSGSTYYVSNASTTYGYTTNSSSTSGMSLKSIGSDYPWSDVGEDKIKTSTVGNYTFYHYVITARYGANISSDWPDYAWMIAKNINKLGTGTTYYSVSWITNSKSKYAGNHGGGNTGASNIKGIYYTMSEELVLGSQNSSSNYVHTPDNDQTGETPTHILQGRYQSSNLNNYYYKIFLGDGTDYPSETTYAMYVVSQGGTDAQSEIGYAGYEFKEKKTPGTTTTYQNVNYTNIEYYYQPIPYDLVYSYLDSNGNTVTTTKQYYYNQSLAAANIYNDTALANTPTGYEFKGWYKNSAGLGEPFDFSSETMPLGGFTLYAVYEKLWYLVKIDPNGGSLNGNTSGGSDSTWFWRPYGSTISQYEISREYLESSSGTYYYHYDEYNADYDDSAGGNSENAPTNYRRRAYYTTDVTDATDTTTKYVYQKDAYALMGWYEVVDGVQSDTPYNFSTQIDHDTTLIAVWRRAGTYYVEYSVVDPRDSTHNATYKEPDSDDYGYSDGAEIAVRESPEDYYDRDSYIFEGWQLVDESGNALSYTYYSPGDKYTVQSTQAYSGTIHFKAVFVSKSEISTHIPDTVDLILDSNEDGEISKPEHVEREENYVGIYDDAEDIGDYSAYNLTQGVWFAKQPNNFSVYLGKYSDSYGTTEVFAHDTDFLLGWDAEQDAETIRYIPTYAGDAVIGIDKEAPLPNILYAIWEPMVYLTLKNETDTTITTYLGGLDTSAMSVVNTVEGKYERSAYEFGIGNAITLTAGQELILVLPKGAGQTFTLSGDNPLSEGNALVINTSDGVIPTQNDLSDVTIPYGSSYTGSDVYGTLVTATVTNGAHVVFTSKEAWTLYLDHNDGDDSTIDVISFTADDVSSSYTLPTLPDIIGFEFLGWSADENATTATYDGGETISDPRSTLFGSNHTATLYAVWKSLADGEILVYNQVTGMGDTTKEFEYTVTLGYKNNSSGTSYNQSFNSSPLVPTFALAHGDYVRVKVSITRSGNRSNYSYSYTVTITKSDGTTVGTYTQTASQYFQVTVTQSDYSSEQYETSVANTTTILTGYGSDTKNDPERYYQYTNSGQPSTNTGSVPTAPVSGVVIFTNHIPVPVPTDLKTADTKPTHLIFLTGLVLLIPPVVMKIRKKKDDEDDFAVSAAGAEPAPAAADASERAYYTRRAMKPDRPNGGGDRV